MRKFLVRLAREILGEAGAVEDAVGGGELIGDGWSQAFINPTSREAPMSYRRAIGLVAFWAIFLLLGAPPRPALAQCIPKSTVEIGADQFSCAFGPVSLLVAKTGGVNVILGEAVNDAMSGASVLPAATIGAGKVTSTGNTVFGVYGLAELRASHGVAVGAEFTTRNFSGNAPDTNLPPNMAPGTTTSAVPIGMNVTCGTGGDHDCAIGAHVSNESGSYADKAFNTAMYVDVFRQYGVFIEAMPSGNQTSAVLKNNGTGLNLSLHTTGAMQPNSAVINVFDAVGTSHFSVRQNGDTYVAGARLTPIASTSLPGCAPASEGALYAVNDASVATFNSAFTGGGSNHVMAYCNGTQWVVH